MKDFRVDLRALHQLYLIQQRLRCGLLCVLEEAGTLGTKRHRRRDGSLRDVLHLCFSQPPLCLHDLGSSQSAQHHRQLVRQRLTDALELFEDWLCRRVQERPPRHAEVLDASRGGGGLGHNGCINRLDDRQQMRQVGRALVQDAQGPRLAEVDSLNEHISALAGLGQPEDVLEIKEIFEGEAAAALGEVQRIQNPHFSLHTS
mmetsp:Transcript_5605/g.13363  ORF Transcript_5605/g.13363 Transcript_5605/m.13363 type:complete len:202 (+) Transcript_5605:1432-2037(+)